MENDQTPQISDLAAQLDDALKRLAKLETLAKIQRRSPLVGKPGIKDSTADIAAYANERRPRLSWKQIYRDWKSDYPDDPRNATLNSEKIREAWRRHYGDKRREQSSCPTPKNYRANSATQIEPTPCNDIQLTQNDET